MSRGPRWFAAKQGRRDGNHAAVRDGLIALGFLVADCAGSLRVLDLLVYDRANNAVWLEVKRADGKGRLTKEQVKFVDSLERRRIPWATVESLDDALNVLAGTKAPPRKDYRAIAERNGARAREAIERHVAQLINTPTRSEP